MSHENAALVCKCLGDANRLRVLQLLSDGEQCALQLLKPLRITQPTLSYHMKTLVESGLVRARRDGKWMYYTIHPPALAAFQRFIAGLSAGPPEKE